jgi:hypothetical protein
VLRPAALGAVACRDADVPHLRRLTPSPVSRSVLLQRGRMPGAGGAPREEVTVHLLAGPPPVTRGSPARCHHLVSDYR